MRCPNLAADMRHVALHVGDNHAAKHFYVDSLGMQVEWPLDPDSVYLTSGNDNLTLHGAEGIRVTPAGSPIKSDST